LKDEAKEFFVYVWVIKTSMATDVKICKMQNIVIAMLEKRISVTLLLKMKVGRMILAMANAHRVMMKLQAMQIPERIIMDLD